MAGERQLAPAPEGETVDGGEDGLGQRRHGLEEPLARPRHRLCVRRREPDELGDVRPRDERLLPRAGDHDCAHRAIAAGDGDRIAKLGHQPPG